MKNYGMPYMGSKSKIVNLIDYILQRHPDKEYFIDLFCGGFAVSHYVLENSNLKILANDKNKYVVALLKKTIYEGLPDKVYDFVSRDTFNDVKNNPNKYEDWYVGFVSIIYSFGTGRQTYMFGKDIELTKKIMHDAIVYNKWDDRIKKIELIIPEKIKKINYKDNKDKRLYFINAIKNNFGSELEQLQRPERLQQLQQLERLQQLQQLDLNNVIHFFSMDYLDFINQIPKSILEKAIIYCDPPYKDTAEYSISGLDYEYFWNWVKTFPYPIYVSSYEAPCFMKNINFELKRSLLQGGAGLKKKENIYWNMQGSYNATLLDQLFNAEEVNKG